MVLKLPSDESFARLSWIGGSVYPTNDWFWIKASPHAAVGTGTIISNGPIAHISSNLPGFTAGASIHQNASGTPYANNDGRSLLCEWAPGAEVEVRASFVRRVTDSTSGASVDGGFRVCGIIQRAGGTYSTTTSERINYVDHYLLAVEASSALPTADLTATIYCVTHSSGAGSSGTSRLVAQQAITGGIGGLDLDAGVDVSLAIEDVGGSPVLTAKLFGYKVSGSRKKTLTLFDSSTVTSTVTPGTSVTISSGEVTDANAGKITGTGGGFGFTTAVTRTDTVGSTAVDVTEGILFVRVTDLATSTVLMEDTFERVGVKTPVLSGSDFSVFDIITSEHGDAGAAINSLWYYGGSANTGNAAADVGALLDRSNGSGTGRDYATVSLSDTSPWPSDAPNDREFISTRPSDYDYSHHRSIEFKPFDHQVLETNWAAATDTFGIFARGEDSGLGYLNRAWVARLVYVIEKSGSSPSQTSLYCYLSVRLDSAINGTPSYLDLWRKSLQGTVDLLDGAWHSLDYDVHTYDGATTSVAPRIHAVEVDGAAVVFDEALAYAAGTQVLADGRVVDSSGFGLSGNMEGFVVESTLNERDALGAILYNPAQVRNWTQETLTTLSGDVAPGDQESYAWVTDEGASESAGTLTDVVTPTFPIAEECLASDLIEVRHDTGHRTTRARASRTRRSYSFEGGAMGQTGINALEAFWESHGVEVPFAFTPDGESAARTCRFVKEPTLRLVKAGTWVPSISIEEVLA
jgi:hypothetical protein